MIKSIDPTQISVQERMGILTAAISPRPIAFAGTVNKDGKPNLAPFSFFNAFGSNPPMLIFSPARRGRENTLKDTFLNIKEVPEVVINTVNYNMVEQMNLASAEYPAGVNEYTKAGFTPLPSTKIRPFRVQESPVQFECKVVNVIETGTSGGAGNLVICQIVMIHLHENIFDKEGKISPLKTDLIGRMGGDFYCRITPDSIFEIKKPLKNLGIGFDALPKNILNSKILTGNDLGQLASVADFPNFSKIQEFITKNTELKLMELTENKKHNKAKELLAEGKREEALLLLLS